MRRFERDPSMPSCLVRLLSGVSEDHRCNPRMAAGAKQLVLVENDVQETETRSDCRAIPRFFDAHRTLSRRTLPPPDLVVISFPSENDPPPGRLCGLVTNGVLLI